MTTRTRTRGPAALVALAALTLIAGCFNPFNPQTLGVGVSEPAPAPSSPSGLLRLYEWCYNHRAISEYTELFTADYRFVFSALDSNGDAYRDVPFTREDELISTGKLFSGGNADEPAASSIVLIFDRSFFIANDTRPGKNGKWHKTINTTVTLTLSFTDGSRTEVRGRAKYFLCRGDSALIPEELVERGFGPDSLRWYIERWEDLTLEGGIPNAVITPITRARARTVDAASVPAPDAAQAFLPDRTTWGGIKALFRRVP